MAKRNLISGDGQAVKEGVVQWQRFLLQQNVGAAASQVAADGYFGPVTQKATRDFQDAQHIPATGVVDERTLTAASSATASTPAPVDLRAAAEALPLTREFEIGPDKSEDLRECRPYFLVPLLELSTSAIRQRTVNRICDAAKKAKADGRPITDLYLISHGWHRNFFDAMAAYDRLLSRFILLRHRNRLRNGDVVQPLLLCLHWHSDPGQDNWTDPAGRRSKESFVANACDKFHLKNPAGGRNMTSDMEDAFQFFSEISAPGVSPFSFDFDDRARDYIGVLTRDYGLAETQNATGPEMASVLWRCFQESTPRKPVEDQQEKPGRMRGLLDAIMSVFNFLTGALGLLAVLAFLLRLIPPISRWPGVTQVLHRIELIAQAFRASVPVSYQQIVGGILYWIGYIGASFVFIVILLLLLSIPGWIYLRYAAEVTRRQKGRSGGHVPYPAVLAWLPIQVLLTLPALVFLIFTMLFGRLLAKPRQDGSLWWLYDERNGARNEVDPGETRSPRVRWATFQLARRPLTLLRDAVGATSGLQSLASAIDNQFAFLDMQRKGVRTGKESAAFLGDLMQQSDALNDPAAPVRVHLIGHSFGCLVVSNLVRHLALDQKPDSTRERFRTNDSNRRVSSVCLLEAAIASNWFEGEPQTRAMVSGAISTIYSRYDSANSFFYPLANSSRLAAGSVGFYLGPGSNVDSRHCFVSLVTTPDLDDTQFGGTGTASAGPGPRVFNLDASRMIYAGPVTSGGAHTDIFKEDVIQLCWAAMTV